jgi:hypothetical protein
MDTNIIKIACKYIDKHTKHYYNIFNTYFELKQIENYSCQTYQIYNRFLNIFIKLQLLDKCSISKLKKDIHLFNKLFKKINDVITDEHYLLDIKTVCIYFDSILTILDNINENNNCIVTDNNCVIQNNNCVVSNNSNNFSVSHNNCTNSSLTYSSNNCHNNNNHHIHNNHNHNHNNHHNHHTHHDKSDTCTSISNNHCDKPNSPQKPLNNKIKKLINESKKKLIKLCNLYDVLLTITIGIERETFNKINTFISYDNDTIINNIDIDYQINLMNIYYNQFNNIISEIPQNLNLDSQIINIYLSNGKYFSICSIDTITIEQTTTSIKINIGKTQYIINFLTVNMSVENSIYLFEQNFNNIKNIILCIKSNKKIVTYFLSILDNIIC